jgi:tetratricopeptide (TPR) repeat protein
MLYIETKRYMEAIPLLEKALVLYPTDPLIYQNLGLAAIGLDPQRNLQAAENYFKKSLELDPTSGAAWYNLGYAYHLQGRNKEAIEVREI